MKVYIAGKLCDESERENLENIAGLCEDLGFETFLPHREVGLAEGINNVKEIFKGDIIQGFKNVKYELYQGPANLLWDTFCYTYLFLLEKFFSRFKIEFLLKPVIFINDKVVRIVYPFNNFIDSFFFKTGNSNGFFIWGEK